ncbi:hypothetical protein BY996DRAFT_6655717 [Phakopsora pachyrhizi]|nr:hypothetical protein BY996DRAFT_6655717 [Phakopsora pachyrhizi]
MDEDTRTLMSFLNSGPPDLDLQAGTSQILHAAREGADIEDALEDNEATGGMGSHHTLLHQSTDNVFGQATLTKGDGLNRSQHQMDIHSVSVDQWINATENLLGGGVGQFIEYILDNVAYGQQPIHIYLGQGPNGPSLGGMVIDPQRGVVMPVGPQGLQAATIQTTPTNQVSGQTLMPLATLPHWSEEA